MDPNETLRQMIALASRIESADFPTTWNDRWNDSVVLAGLVRDLHEWIIKGGFLPDRWEVVQKRAREDNNV